MNKKNIRTRSCKMSSCPQFKDAEIKYRFMLIYYKFDITYIVPNFSDHCLVFLIFLCKKLCLL